MKSIVPEAQVDVNMTVSNDSILQLYHERYGHQDKQHVKAIIERELDMKVKADSKLCEACVYGKAHRLKFGTRKKPTKAGELISTDLCGPFDESFRKFRYLAVFKDVYTKFRYGFFLKHKSEVKDVLQDFIVHAKNLGHDIKEMITDNGGEFDCEEVRKILKKHGITPRLSAPYTPQQNGSVERESRIIVEMARTLKYSNEEANFPAALWAELVSTAIYILNRTGKSSVPNKSPYELWMKRQPRIKHMRIIGSICYAHIPPQKRRKMDKKAIKGYLVGYDGDERYRIYVRERRAVICSRDVVFDEKPSMTESTLTLPPGQIMEEDLPEHAEKEVIDENSQENKIEETQQMKIRPRRQITAPIWTKDYVMENPETVKENFPETNIVTNEETS